MDYAAFLERKTQLGGDHGFKPKDLPGFLYDFQAHLVEWACRRGRAAILADCGLGKSPMSLAWCDQVVRKTNGRVLVATPLAVSYQWLREAAKFGIDASAPDGTAKIHVTNYERLHKLDASSYVGMVCDESSILKSFDGVRRAEITAFMRKMAYRLLCTATAAPNDYVELGTSSEALGELGYMDMLTRFFKNQQNSGDTSAKWRRHGGGLKWRFRGHAEQPFWRWVCSWARAVRKPDDIGFADARFVLPPLEEREHVVTTRTKRPGFLFDLPAENMQEEREERRRTIEERCELVAKLADHKSQVIVWCHLNDEGDRLADMIRGALQVRGSDAEGLKEERLCAFADGKLRCLVTKPKIGAWGLNLQRCAHVITFPSHSYEQYYQAVRRCWRFGQRRKVVVDIVSTEGERGIADNLKRKAEQADRMFASLVENMNNELRLDRKSEAGIRPRAPQWLSTIKS